MQILRSRKELGHLLNEIREKNLEIGLIPTMSSIHEGHLLLSSTFNKSRLFISIYIGQVRAIDNFILY